MQHRAHGFHDVRAREAFRRQLRSNLDHLNVVVVKADDVETDVEQVDGDRRDDDVDVDVECKRRPEKCELCFESVHRGGSKLTQVGHPQCLLLFFKIAFDVALVTVLDLSYS